VEALFPRLFGAHWEERFAAVVCAEDAPQKKPDPLAYRLALERLALPASTALAIEDSPNGLAAATAAGLATLITRSVYFAHEPFVGAALVCDDLDRPVDYCGQRSDRVGLALCEAVLRHVEQGRRTVKPARP
jgi:beta-phosphoglucomutase-like phosphatase (HAD superfamily)